MVHDMESPKTQGALARFHNVEWLERVFRESDALNIERDLPRCEAMALAQLRSYVALSLENGNDESTRLRLASRRKRSRIYVYNFQNYSGRHCGPFLDDGSADWIHIEHLVNVMVLNLRQLPGVWSNIKPPLGLTAICRHSVSTDGRETIRDWARVEGEVTLNLSIQSDCQSSYALKVPGDDMCRSWIFGQLICIIENRSSPKCSRLCSDLFGSL
ncbi:hypothetical protein DXG03_004466 [Asterophora parasitica]|uniref:Uncharacterized protein n=1 Tax=Asterophora parasitica TaxID=117018 RepID=A0A9P7G9M3_9AGAR|nr:hypothetical protein DXG03_004466 [Asterophora parasitica]